MFRKILVCSDLSPASDALVRCVEELKTVGMKEIVLAHAIPYPEFPLRQEAHQALDRQVKMLGEHGVRVLVNIPSGPAGQILAETAESQEVSVIFIGSHGKGILRAAALGSVSNDLLHHARRPVLLARIALLEGDESLAVCRKIFSNILFATDFSDTAENALKYVGVIARETGAQVTLLHVLEPGGKDPAEERQAEEMAQYLLEAKRERVRGAGAADVTTALVKGNAEKEVAAVARKGRYSLIVMGFRGKGVVKEMMGSVASEAARHAGVPVLFIPAPD
ncbi:universal stress protein [Geomonas sp. RF6]|uniref:universal stress protein n=1 Tax=Geomonas sp. RF6 TaxID=2897342 RepID=UPI001E49F24D|nr:universal stress protein [Geomonas sp. RF6]UFS69752.1 universal stress protein [Geomonas sp. RF6]